MIIYVCAFVLTGILVVGTVVSGEFVFKVIVEIFFLLFYLLH